MPDDHTNQEPIAAPNGFPDAGGRPVASTGDAVSGSTVREPAGTNTMAVPPFGYPPPMQYPAPPYPYPPPQYAYPYPYPYPYFAAPAPVPDARVQTAERGQVGQARKGCCGDCPPSSDCGCQGDCCFEVLISRVRVMEDQGGALSGGSGVGEAGDGGNFSDDMELVFNVLADGQGEVYPSLTSFISISKRHRWVAVNKVVNRLPVPCGGSRTVPLTAEVMEVETTVAGGRPEVGSESGTLVLSCGCPTVPAQILVRLAAGGQADQAEVLVEVTARQV